MNKKYKYLILVLLVLSSLLAFGRIVGNDFVNYDDNLFITENNHIQAGFNNESIKWAFTTSHYSYWHPLTWLSIMLDWRLFGANASGHHLMSLLWHIGSAILLFLFLSKTTGALWPSAFVAALFALHPLRVESVAWAAERKDVLSVFFGMATLYAYAYYVEKPQISKYFLCLILFALALMSKPMLISLPFVMLLLDYWPLGRWQKASTPASIPAFVDKSAGMKKKKKKLKVESSVNKKIAVPIKSGRQLIGSLLWEKVPFFFLALALSIMLIWKQQSFGSMASLQQFPLSSRIMNALLSYMSYLGNTFWPVDLAAFYPYEQSFQVWQVLGASLILFIISIALIYFIKKAPFLFVGWFWYLGVLFPVIGLMQAGAQAMADRYTYFPSIGIAIILTWGIVYLLPKVKLRKILIMPAVIILVALTFLTWQQCGYWKNGIILFEHTLQITKNNAFAHQSLGFVLAAQGKYDEAIAHYHKALEISPNYIYAHYNLGVALDAQGKKEEANTHYLAVMKLDPYSCDAHYNLAVAFERQGKIEEAITHYRKVLRINPEYSSAHVNLGVLLEMQSKHNEAIYHYRQALRTDPNDPGIHFNIGVVLINKGNLKEAVEHFRQAVYLNPDYEEARRALKLALDMEQQKR